tara:strand:+ start:25186 stop:26154 length:969 start_codon:yes stop_codon:yes gene_type:complete
MGIERSELQSLIIQTRQFLNLTHKFLDSRNEALQIRAVADSLYINYAIGLVVDRNIQQSSEELIKNAQKLGLSSVASYSPGLKFHFIDKPYWNFQQWLNGGMDAAWQNRARNVAQDIRQILLCSQEWLELESYNIHMVAEGLPIPTHLQFDEALRPVQQKLKEIMDSDLYQTLIAKLTPMSQTQSWLSDEMRAGMQFLRLRVDWRLLQDRRKGMLAKQGLTDSSRFPEMDLVGLGQADLSKLATMLKQSPPEETSMTHSLFRHNTAMKAYLPLGISEALKLFSEAQENADAQQVPLTADELEKISDMKEMPRPNGFGLGKSK